jgi:hypothetical protein
MPAAWPATVTQLVDSSGYRETVERNVVEFAPEVGPPMARRRSSVSSDLISFSTTPVTDDEYDALVGFYRDTLKDGALTFLRTHPRNMDGPMTEFRFVEPPQWSPIDATYGRIALSLRRMP